MIFSRLQIASTFTFYSNSCSSFSGVLFLQRIYWEDRCFGIGLRIELAAQFWRVAVKMQSNWQAVLWMELAAQFWRVAKMRSNWQAVQLRNDECYGSLKDNRWWGCLGCILGAGNPIDHFVHWSLFLECKLRLVYVLLVILYEVHIFPIINIVSSPTDLQVLSLLFQFHYLLQNVTIFSDANFQWPLGHPWAWKSKACWGQLVLPCDHLNPFKLIALVD